MLLSSYKLDSLIFQLNYPDAYHLWDRAGAIASRLGIVWGGLKVAEGKPNQQIMVGRDVVIETGLNKSVASLKRKRTTDPASTTLLKHSFDTWCTELELRTLGRVSTRAIYVREFSSLKDANEHLCRLPCVVWPKSKVFNQSIDSGNNSIDLSYRFQDEESFANLRVKSERLTFKAELDRDFVDEDIEVPKNRSVVDFDRGAAEVDVRSFNMDEWLKGFHHLLRRDLAKVVGDEQ